MNSVSKENGKLLKRLKPDDVGVNRVDNSLAARRAYNHHDGDVTPSEIDDDLSSEHISELKASYYRDKVVVSAEEITEIEVDTREQSGSNR